jgi:hypothetical protein
VPTSPANNVELSATSYHLPAEPPQEERDYDVSLDMRIGLIAGECHPRFNEYIVETTRRELDEGMSIAQSHSQQEQRRRFGDILRNVNRYTDGELSEHHRLYNQEFKDWCNGVALCLIYRKLILNRDIPVVALPFIESASVESVPLATWIPNLELSLQDSINFCMEQNFTVYVFWKGTPLPVPVASLRDWKELKLRFIQLFDRSEHHILSILRRLNLFEQKICEFQNSVGVATFQQMLVTEMLKRALPDEEPTIIIAFWLFAIINLVERRIVQQDDNTGYQFFEIL